MTTQGATSGFGLQAIRSTALIGAGWLALAANAAHGQAVAQQPRATDANAAKDANGTNAESDDGTRTTDIVVTAERRAMNLQDTPLSILAVTQETVEAKGIQDLQDLSHFTPNLNITPTRGNGTGAVNFTIRGISGGGGAAGERGVGLYVDGIFMPRTSGSVLRVLDIDRIEVLRGPQGTLFGRNSTGGAIRIFSKQPTDVLEGSLEVTGGNFDRRDVVGMINVPLGNGFAVRAQGAYLNKGGFVRRGTEMLGAERDYVGRIQVAGELTPDLKITAGFLYNKSEANGSPFVVQEFDLRPGIDGIIQGNYGGWLNDAFKAAGQAPIAPYNDPRFVKGPYAASDVCFLDDFDPDYDPACNQINNDDYWQADLRIDWKPTDDLSVHSISGYSKLKHRAQNDLEMIGFERRYDDIDSKVFYQELQLNAALLNNAIDLVTGVTYFHEDSAAPNNYVLNRRGTATYPSNKGNPPNSDGGLYTRTISDVFQTSDSFGLFGSATWHIIDGLNLTGGLRQAWDHKDYRQNRYQPPTTQFQGPDFVFRPGVTSSSASKSQSFQALDYRATLDYHFTPDIMAYATVSKAYKAGSFSATLQGYTPPPATAPPGTLGIGGDANQDSIVATLPNEKVINYEAGVRATLFDRRLRINPTIFKMEWSNRQAAVRVNCGTAGTALANLVAGSAACPVGFLPLVQDQGTAKIKGLEVDAQLVLIPGLTLDGNLGLTDYKLTNVPVVAAGAFPIAHLFPDIPKISYSLGFSYGIHEAFGRATMSVNYAFVGKQWVYPDDNPDSTYRLPSYGLVNARFQIEPANLPITLTIAANNLLGEVYATYAQRFGGGFWDSGAGTGIAAPPRNMLSVVRGRPRDLSLSLKYSF
ncbi:MAG: TonB-dependent receptor [Croceibacterium sp.]